MSDQVSQSAAAGKPTEPALSPTRRGVMLTTLIIAGEAAFFMPFLLPRTFRPTIRDVFAISNEELGLAQAAYGLIATVAYALGGPLADLIRPRYQIAIALMATSLGGILLWQIPSLSTLNALYVYWGFTISAFFWAALMKATREIGGELAPGTAFGLLDGGRGLLAVLLSTLLVGVYESLLPADVEAATLAQRTVAFQWVIAITALSTFLAGLPVLLLIPNQIAQGRKDTYEVESMRQLKSFGRGMLGLLSMPTVWLQAVIIICAYAAFKSTDDFSSYAKDVFGDNEVEAAKLQNLSLWIRPIAAVAFGLMADRLRVSYLVAVCFGLVLVGGIGLTGDLWWTGNIWGATSYSMFVANVVSVSIGAYALRGLYFAIMVEAKIPLIYTGTAVGFASVVGYSPEFFMAPLIGNLTDNYADGHQRAFLVVTGFALLGLAASGLFRYVVWRQDRQAGDAIDTS